MPIDDLSIRYPLRARVWRLKTQSFTLGARPLLMGIVNVTPDSFSDGGAFIDPAKAINHALRLVGEGADILDIGGESTRPYATPVAAEEELQRVMPVIEGLAKRTSVPISIDTSKAIVAAKALAAGAEIINDVTGFEGDPAMVRVACETGAGVCAMHMQGSPQTMQDDPTYGDVVEEIYGYLRDRAAELMAAGIARERICLDPGIGFGKTHQHNLTLASRCDRYHELGYPILAGHSRKGFIGKVLGNKELDRTAGTIGVSLSLARQGVQILRVHDVAAVRQALHLFVATGGIDGREARLPG